MNPRQQKLKRRLALTRDCGLCRACCTTQLVEDMTIQGILALSEEKTARLTQAVDGRVMKLADVACPYLADDMNAPGCTIYPDRPNACADWMCVWRSGSGVLLGSERPDRLGLVFDTILRKDLPFSFLSAVAAEPENAAEIFARTEPTLKRLVAGGHLVVCEMPNGFQTVLGPLAKVEAYTKVARLDSEKR